MTSRCVRPDVKAQHHDYEDPDCPFHGGNLSIIWERLFFVPRSGLMSAMEMFRQSTGHVSAITACNLKTDYFRAGETYGLREGDFERTHSDHRDRASDNLVDAQAMVFRQSNWNRLDLCHSEGKPRSSPPMDSGKSSIYDLPRSQQTRQQVVQGGIFLDSNDHDFWSRNHSCIINRVPDNEVQTLTGRCDPSWTQPGNRVDSAENGSERGL